VKRLNEISCFSSRLVCFAAAFMLAAGAASLGVRASAQQPDSTASGPQAKANHRSPITVDAEAEEPGDNAFRHSKIIKSAARILHISVEATARSFELINIAIVVLAIGIPLYRFLPGYLHNRSLKLGTDIESARRQAEDANSRLSAIETKLTHLDEEIAKFRAELEAETKQDEARIQAALETERTRIVASVEQEIGAAAAHARRGLRRFAAELAVDRAARQMTITPETDRALIAEFVSDVKNGGAN
jgi:F-type H+-transporting ATPase subunit b